MVFNEADPIERSAGTTGTPLTTVYQLRFVPSSPRRRDPLQASSNRRSESLWHRDRYTKKVLQYCPTLVLVVEFEKCCRAQLAHR